MTRALSRSDRRSEAAIIWASHGVADGVSTAIAAQVLGVGGEGNPIVRSMLGAGSVPTLVAMLAIVGVASIAWPTAADAVDAPRWIGLSIAAVGLLAALVNVAAVLVAGGLA